MVSGLDQWKINEIIVYDIYATAQVPRVHTLHLTRSVAWDGSLRRGANRIARGQERGFNGTHSPTSYPLEVNWRHKSDFSVIHIFIPQMLRKYGGHLLCKSWGQSVVANSRPVPTLLELTVIGRSSHQARSTQIHINAKCQEAHKRGFDIDRWSEKTCMKMGPLN